MRHKFSKTIVIALGGSIIYPDAIDVSFLKNFKKFILNRLASKSYRRSGLRDGSRFIIVVGGGRIARVYQEAADKVFKISDEDKDWLGIHSTRANAHLLRTIFREVADPVIIDSRDKMRNLSARGGSPASPKRVESDAFGGKYPVTIASGWRPGWSTDYVSIAIAEHFKAKEAIIAGKPAHVYDKDPHKYSDAKEIHEITWKKYRKLIPAKWKPGLHSPVDPVSARLAEKKGISAIIVDGKNLKNFENMLSGKEFKGSVIG